MDFPETYLKHKKVRVWWDYSWGKTEDTFFHCAYFEVIKDGELSTATHISIHNPKPHYYEISGGFQRVYDTRLYDVGRTRVIIKDNKHYIKHKGHCRKHKYNTSCDAFLLNHNTQRGMGWCGTETSRKHWANIIYEGPKVDNWEWLGIKLDDGRDIMVYNTTRKKYCCLIENGRAKESKKFWCADNFLNLPEWDLNINIIPIAKEKIFSPKVGMDYSEQPFMVETENGGGYGMCERTYG